MHTHRQSCTPRIGSSKEEKLELGINGASCRLPSQLLCSSLESSWAPAGTSPPHPQFRACSRQSCLSHSSIHHHILQIFIRCLLCAMLCGRGEGSMVSGAKPWASVYSSMKWGITWIAQDLSSQPQSSHLELLSEARLRCGRVSRNLGRGLRRGCRVASGWRDKEGDVVPEPVSSDRQ